MKGRTNYTISIIAVCDQPAKAAAWLNGRVGKQEFTFNEKLTETVMKLQILEKINRKADFKITKTR